MFNQTSRSVIAIILFITLLLSTTFVFAEENETQQDNYYLKGQYAAQQDYKGWGAFLGGVFSTYLLFGFTYSEQGLRIHDAEEGIPIFLTTWACSYYLFAASRDTDVPQRYISEFDMTQSSGEGETLCMGKASGKDL